LGSADHGLLALYTLPSVIARHPRVDGLDWIIVINLIPPELAG
jgi:hypothetical protein